MRVLLIRPPVPPHTIGLKHIMVCEPLELEYVAAGLQGHEVQILDLILERGLDRRLREFQPDVVGTSCYITGVNEAIKVCRAVKRWRPDCLTVVGGVQVSLAPEDFADAAIDCLALGDGTTLMAEILSAWSCRPDLSDVPGLIHFVGGRAVRTAERPYMPSPDELPFPRRDLVAHLRHRYFYLFHRPVATLKTTWGCWYRCNFCCNWRITGGKPHVRSPESIAAELETIDCEDVYIVDDLFLFDRKRLSRLAQLLRERGIRKKFLVFGRADFIAENEDVIREWASLGLTAVLVGLEAATDAELDAMDKRCRLDANYRAVEVLHRNGVDTYGSLIPHPDYLPEDWERLWQFVRDTGLFYLNVSPLTPLPGTLQWELHKHRITVPRKAHGLWDLSHCVLPTRMPLRDYYRELRRLYTRACLDPRRSGRLTLRPRPPVWSIRNLRLMSGIVRIFLQLLRAHRHHDPRELERAMDVGPAPVPARPPLQECELDLRRTGGGLRVGRGACDAHFATGRGRLPDPDGLLGHRPVREVFARIAAAQGEDVYPYQRPLQDRSGPRVRIAGRSLLMLSSYDYLGLIGHPEIEAAAVEAVRRFGTASGGVRLLTGTTRLHEALDAELARFKGTESAVTFSSGYLANLAVIGRLLGPADRVIIDSLAHRSLVEACRLAGVQRRTFAHNDVADLQRELEAAPSDQRTLIVVEGVYSMDGDICPLPGIVALKRKHGAHLMVDEAHSFCVLGRTGRGVDEHHGLDPHDVDIWMGTLSKAVPSNGGFVAGTRELVVGLQHVAPPFIFSAALCPSAAGAALASLRVVIAEPERIVRAHDRARHLACGLQALGFDTGETASPIVPVLLGEDEVAFGLAQRLYDLGLLVTPVVFPAVPRGGARLRLCATAGHSEGDIDEALSLFRRARVEVATTA